MTGGDHLKKMKKLIAACAVLALGLTTLAGCGGKTTKEAEGKKKIGIIQLVDHESLDAARKGFVARLGELGYNDGAQVEIDYQNANGDQATNNTIADKFANGKKDLILAIATPSAQAVANKIKDVPILFTAISDPVGAGLVESIEKPGKNVTGTSDMVSIPKQLDMMFAFKPDIKTVGLLYCSAEDNSLTQIKEAKDYLKKQGKEFIDMTVQNSNDVQSVLEANVEKVQAIYVPTDNVIATSMSTVAKVTEPKKVPVIGGSVEMVQNGGTATLGLDYNSLGRQTADMAVKILKGEAKAADMPVEFAKEDKIELNEANIKALGLTVPDKYKK